LNVLAFNQDISTAINSPRVNPSIVPLFVPVETGFSSDIISALQADGHNITVT
jgi:gamma-glutamyltranspeptidase